MLDELAVSNLGLIAEASIEPGPGLIALTGETGAGKTLLLGALRLLRGDQARTDRIGPAAGEARVDGRFLLGEDEVTVGRRVTPSRFWLKANPNVKLCRVLGKNTPSRFWLKVKPSVKLCRLLGKLIPAKF